MSSQPEAGISLGAQRDSRAASSTTKSAVTSRTPLMFALQLLLAGRWPFKVGTGAIRLLAIATAAVAVVATVGSKYRGAAKQGFVWKRRGAEGVPVA